MIEAAWGEHVKREEEDKGQNSGIKQLLKRARDEPKREPEMERSER